MHFLLCTCYRLRWLHAPLGLLLLLLQRTPMLRMASANTLVLETRAGDLLKSVFTLAALGACDSVAGATTVATNPTSPASATVGTPFAAVLAFTSTNGRGGSWLIEPGTLPPGIQLGFNPGDGIIYADEGGLLNNSLGIASLTGTPTQAGTYTFNISVFKDPFAGGDSATISYTINVAGTALTPFQQWQAANFTSSELNDSAISGPLATGSDGLSNLMRFALGYSRTQTPPQPILSVSSVEGAWHCSFVRPSAVLGVTYQIEATTDLVTWSATGITPTLIATNGSNQTWRAIIPAAPNRKFFRLVVTQ